ncbi:MAG: glycosyltransferase family 2 protein [Deltaproteobacteria bacterium]|nr:glycosyltransferase family 2 protein [Deltaproteobacteria bacterium]
MIDIVIVNYKSTDYLLKCLKSVHDSIGDIPVRVFVYDNDSKNGVDRVTIAFPNVNLTKNIFNMGFTKAVNEGIKQGTAPYVLLLNPDTIIKDGFFESTLQYLENNPDIGIVGPKILNTDGSLQGSARAFPKPWMALFGRNSLLTKWFPNNRISRKSILSTGSDGITPMFADWVSGACMLTRRKAIDDVGLVDEQFFMYWEDVDLCKRMWDHEWKVAYFPKVSVVHHVGGSSKNRPLRSIIEFHKSSYKVIRKYKITPFYIANSFIIFCLSLRACIMILVNRMGMLSGKLLSFIKSDGNIIRTIINSK